MLLVQACEFIATGDGYYRMHEPMRLLGQQPGVVAVDCHIASRHFWSLIREADVLVFPFFNSWDLFPLIEERQKNGKVTVFESNDYFLDIQPWNPIAEHWLDPDVRTLHVNLIRKCDAVQTSSQRLVDQWKKTAQQIVAFDNHLSLIPPLVPPPHRPLTIGWAGSQGHLADWYATTRLLQPWLDAHPEVHVAVMGNAAAKHFLRLPEERYFFQEAGNLDTYLAFLPRLDIGFAPLLATEYNRCRSDVKFLEYAAAGVVGIYSASGPYDATVQNNQTGILARTIPAMISELDGLYQDERKRTLIRQNAYRYVSTERKFVDHIGKRVEFYRSLSKLPNELMELPERYRAEAMPTREGNYFRLGHDKLSNNVSQASQAKPDASAALILSQAVAEDPNFLAAFQALGRLLNSQKRPKEAESVLSRALVLFPYDAKTLSELGRSLFLAGDFSAARTKMQEAISHNPYSTQSWSYLLRFSAMHAHPEVPTLIAEMKKYHPESFLLWSDAAQLLTPAKACDLLSEMVAKLGDRSNAERQFALKLLLKPILKTVQRSAQELEVLVLLRLAVQVFPHSLVLADLHAQILSLHGKHAESNKEYARAYQLEEISLAIKHEFPEGNSVNQMRQIGAHLKDLTK